MKQDWLWDRKISPAKAKKILNNSQDAHFLSLAAVLLARKNTVKEVFKIYLKAADFLRNWGKIKRRMRKDNWNEPRIEFWQAIYEKLKEKYEKKGISVPKETSALKPRDEFCKSVADKIRIARKQRSLSQKELAKKLNTSQQLISRVESGRENISLLTLKKIVDCLKAELRLEIS